MKEKLAKTLIITLPISSFILADLTAGLSLLLPWVMVYFIGREVN
tara:strand:- start:197 stop:331 length:135 start_codon:yes stop_codon:yes gene_type:complete